MYIEHKSHFKITPQRYYSYKHGSDQTSTFYKKVVYASK